MPHTPGCSFWLDASLLMHHVLKMCLCPHYRIRAQTLQAACTMCNVTHWLGAHAHAHALICTHAHSNVDCGRFSHRHMVPMANGHRSVLAVQGLVVGPLADLPHFGVLGAEAMEHAAAVHSDLQAAVQQLCGGAFASADGWLYWAFMPRFNSGHWDYWLTYIIGYNLSQQVGRTQPC